MSLFVVSPSTARQPPADTPDEKLRAPLNGSMPLRVLLLAGCLMMLCSAALFNGYPLIYPDSLGYLQHGEHAWRQLTSGGTYDWWLTRSFIYAFSVLPFYTHLSLWSLVAAQAGATLFVVRLVFRLTLPRRGDVTFALIVAGLCVTTCIAWYAGAIMPDFLAPVLVLCIYLLCFGWHQLSIASRAAVFLLGSLAIACHSSHLLLAIGLTFCCFVMLRITRGKWSIAFRIAVRPALVILLATFAMVASNRAIIGRWSLAGNHPPFLLARSIADGPGRLYILDHRDDPKLAIARFADRLPSTTDGFLWEVDGIYHTADRDTIAQMNRQEMDVVLHAALAHPLLQFEASARNFARQLKRFGAWAFGRNPYTLQNVAIVLPDGGRAFVQSRQYRDALPAGLLSRITYPTVTLSSIVAVILLVRNRRLLMLGATIAVGVVLNAAITGVLSDAVDRYQARIIWLVPLLAALALLNGQDPAPPGN